MYIYILTCKNIMNVMNVMNVIYIYLQIYTILYTYNIFFYAPKFDDDPLNAGGIHPNVPIFSG
jgi:hypothetical protein